MKDKFNSMGFNLPITRFSAIDGRKISFTNSLTKETFTGEEILKNKIWLKGNFYAQCLNAEDRANTVFLTNLDSESYNKRIPGDTSCICSHKKIWQEIVDKGYENTLVFEDDVIFFPFFNSLFNLVIKNTPKDYDLLLMSFKNYGGAFHNESKNKFTRFFLTIFDVALKNPFWKPAHKNIMSSQGYIISNEGAKKLL
jgi:GR25 family glycosyltransferase involved in LPS biosynthesis